MYPSLLAFLLLSFPSDGAPHRFFWGNPRPQGAAIRALAFADASHGYGVGRFGATVETEDGGRSWASRGDFATFAKDLNDLVVLEGGDLLAVGASPGIFRSSDGGATWDEVAHPSSEELWSLERVDATSLVAIGEQGSVLRSIDSGVTWTPQSFPAVETLTEQAWLDSTHGFVVGEGIPHQTSNGGATWTPLPGVGLPPSTSYNDIVFGTALDGWILDDFGEWVTHDGGALWTWSPRFVEPLYQGETLAFDALHRLVATSGEGAFLWESFDGGTDYTPLHEQPSGNGFLDLLRLADGTLVASSDIGDLVWSSDGGASWTNATKSPADGIRVSIAAVSVLPNGRAFAAGRDSSGPHRFLRSDDAGHTWREIAHPLVDVQAIAFADLELGFAGGDQDRIARTADGGQSWQSASLGGVLGGDMRVGDFAFTSQATFASSYGAGGKGAVFRSIDGGQSWQLSNQGLPTSRHYSSISFPHDPIGFVCGGGSGTKWLYRTVDGGATWQSMSTAGLPDLLHATHWFDLANGLLTSRSAGIWRTSDGGAHWTQVWTEPCAPIHFRDGLHGIASTTSGELVLSDDAGLTWRSVPAPLPSTYLLGTAPFALPGGFLVGSSTTTLLVASTEMIETYCACDSSSSPCANPDIQAGCRNSTGQGALLSGSNTVSVTSDDLLLFATPLPPNQSVLLFMGAGATDLPFGDGMRCVSPGTKGLFRFPVRNSGPSGLLREGPGLVALSHARFAANGQITAGQTWNFQAWFRDPLGPCGSAFNLSNALRVTFGL